MQVRNHAGCLRSCIVGLGFSLLFSGCASMGENNNQQLLEKAGFKMLAAETPAQQSNVKNMTQRKLTIHDRDGEKLFVYADSEGCDCVYVGKSDAYKKLNAMVDQELAEQRGMAAAQTMDEAMYWEDWPLGNW